MAHPVCLAHTQTMLHATFVAIGRIYAMHAVWPKITAELLKSVD